MSKTWIVDQSNYMVSQWDVAMENQYPEVKQWNRDADKYFEHVCVKCNFLDAVKVIDWAQYINVDSKVLDLGCGGGWLSAYLSTFENIGKIYSIDSSKHYLEDIMPEVIKTMDGNEDKIDIIQGMFSPILLEDDSLDLIVASAAVHHADNLEGLLSELNKKLKKGGHLIILNETPSNQFKYILRLLFSFSKTILKVIMKKYETSSPKISASGFEYDPYLGDRMYARWYWKEAIGNTGFQLCEIVDSMLPTIKGSKSESLKHFVCKKI